MSMEMLELFWYCLVDVSVDTSVHVSAIEEEEEEWGHFVEFD